MSRTNRRDFLRTSSAATAGIALSNMGILRPGRGLGANDRVREASIGAGDRMMSSLVPAFQTHTEALNIELVAVCDIWKKRREEAPLEIAQKYKIKKPMKARNTEELYGMKDID